jgi:8-oxo-dGTP pyrophosphatase MutT (NUDIX family)
MLPRPRRTATRVVATYPFLEVREHDLVHDGGQAQEVVTIHLRDWAIVAATTDEGRHVLVEQHRHGIDGPSLELAAGVIDEGESPAEAARRELLEETGYEAAEMIPLGWAHPNPALHDNRAFFFLARGAKKTREPLDAFDERVNVVVLDDGELDEAERASRVTHAMALLGLARVRAHLAGRRDAHAVLDEMERHQRARVVELARRLRPGLTAEDLASPHDFPELDDPDWHFEDGQLAGIQAVRFALSGRGGSRGSKEG